MDARCWAIDEEYSHPPPPPPLFLFLGTCSRPRTLSEYKQQKPKKYVELGKLGADLNSDELVAKVRVSSVRPGLFVWGFVSVTLLRLICVRCTCCAVFVRSARQQGADQGFLAAASRCEQAQHCACETQAGTPTEACGQSKVIT